MPPRSKKPKTPPPPTDEEIENRHPVGAEAFAFGMPDDLDDSRDIEPSGWRWYVPVSGIFKCVRWMWRRWKKPKSGSV